ncbi:hypothetical protein, partial [Rhodoferax sp.]|uniref:hypothetical protein n=1 Tax=Rhodoferax sp. TaxID=50421 RepID=UPI0025CEE38F
SKTTQQIDVNLTLTTPSLALHIYIRFMSEALDYGTLYLPFTNFLYPTRLPVCLCIFVNNATQPSICHATNSSGLSVQQATRLAADVDWLSCHAIQGFYATEVTRLTHNQTTSPSPLAGHSPRATATEAVFGPILFSSPIKPRAEVYKPPHPAK